MTQAVGDLGSGHFREAGGAWRLLLAEAGLAGGDLVYHWTEARFVASILGEGIRPSTGGFEGHHEDEPGVCLTLDGEDPAEWWNPNIFYVPRPTRLTVAAGVLDVALFGPDLNSLLEDGTVCSTYGEADLEDPAEHTLSNSLRFTRNFRYGAAVPPRAILAAAEFEAPRWWKVGEEE